MSVVGAKWCDRPHMVTQEVLTHVTLVILLKVSCRSWPSGIKPSSWHHTKNDICLLTHPCDLDFTLNTELKHVTKCSWFLYSHEAYEIAHFVG